MLVWNKSGAKPYRQPWSSVVFGIFKGLCKVKYPKYYIKKFKFSCSFDMQANQQWFLIGTFHTDKRKIVVFSHVFKINSTWCRNRMLFTTYSLHRQWCSRTSLIVQAVQRHLKNIPWIKAPNVIFSSQPPICLDYRACKGPKLYIVLLAQKKKCWLTWKKKFKKRFCDFLLFGLVWQYSLVQTKYRLKVIATYLQQ